MVQPASASKNLWVAASDGDIDRVRHLIEQEGATPNDKDSNSYSPMHAAASYHHYSLLEYLLSVGGDINLPDDEGETPLFTVENVEAAKWLIEHGADPARTNEEGQTAAEYHEEDHPEIAAYLHSLNPSSNQAGDDADVDAAESRVDAYTSAQAEALIEETQRVMAEAAARGEDPEAALKEIVERAVRDGMDFGGQLGDVLEDGRKRTRRDGEGGGPA